MSSEERIELALKRIDTIEYEAEMVMSVSIPQEEGYKIFNERAVVAKELKKILLGEKK